VAALRRHGELDISDELAAQLMAMSAATIDRRLAPVRAETTLTGGRSLTKPGSLVKSQIPMRTWADWDDKRPGFLEIDLVGHDGGDLNGEHCFTLTATDIATGWTETRPRRDPGPDALPGAGHRFGQRQRVHQPPHDDLVRRQRDHLHPIASQQLQPRRHVEQKNWTIVRRTAGYWRYETPTEMAMLNQIWTALSPLTNLFTPQQKLLTKTRVGAKVTKTYDTA
jgi:hypothetical protein